MKTRYFDVNCIFLFPSSNSGNKEIVFFYLSTYIYLEILSLMLFYLFLSDPGKVLCFQKVNTDSGVFTEISQTVQFR